MIAASLVHYGGPEVPYPPLPKMSVDVPYAVVVYDRNGLHVTYTIAVLDTVGAIRWHTQRRYSEFRALHRAVGRHYTSSSFPSMLITSRANRSKKEIELRRVKLNAYVNSLVAEMFSGTASIPLGRLSRTLDFLDHPQASRWHGPQMLGDGEGTESNVASVIDPAHGGAGRISALDVEDDIPLIVTKWQPPRILPGERLGLNMPFVTVGMNIEGHWEATVKGERPLRRGLLMHRYDEAQAICEALHKAEHIMDPSDAQRFILAFRKQKPLAQYMSKEATLMREVAHLAARSESPTTGESSSVTHRNVRSRSRLTATPVNTRSALGHFVLARGAPKMARYDPNQNIQDAMAARLRGPLFEQCQCTATSFCSSEQGDVYLTPSGFVIAVCPPKV